MSEHHDHTEFLKHCLRYDESDRRKELEQEIAQIQRDAHCIRRSVLVTALLIALTLACYAYGMVLMENFTHNATQFILNSICALGVGSAISLVVFLALGWLYRRKLDHRREECRMLVMKLLESRLRQPDGAKQHIGSTPHTETILPSTDGGYQQTTTKAINHDHT